MVGQDRAIAATPEYDGKTAASAPIASTGCGATWPNICVGGALLHNTAANYLQNLRVADAVYESAVGACRISLPE